MLYQRLRSVQDARSRADIVERIRRSEAFGIDAELTGVDFASIVEESNEPFDAEAAEMEERMRDDENLTLCKAEGRFVDERTLRVDDERITGRKDLVAAGARPTVPSSMPSIDEVEYSTSTEALRWSERRNGWSSSEADTSPPNWGICTAASGRT